MKHSEWLLRDDVAEQARRSNHANPATLEAIDDLVYAPYLERQQRELAARRRDGMVMIHHAFDYARVPGLLSDAVIRTRMNWCAEDSAGKLSKAAFDLLKGRYPKSKEALTTKYWFKPKT